MVWTVLDPRACLAACVVFSLLAPVAAARAAEPAPAQAETPAAPLRFAVLAQPEAGITANPDQPADATATITFKIPVTTYQATLASLDGGDVGTQLSLRQQAQDVTEQVADVDSQVTSDEAAIAQLRGLLKDAGSVQALLDVQNQINSEEGQLEAMEAQQKALDDETAYATVTVTIAGPKAPAARRGKPAPPPGLGSGASGGWHAFRLTVDWIAAIIGAVAPFAAAVAVLTIIGWWVRRRLRRVPAAPTAAEE